MNLNSNAVGLSARQKINSQFDNFFWVLLILLVVFLASAVKTTGQLKESKKVPPKTGNEPKVDIKVNRHYDNKGNVIGYDSTYSTYYSSIGGDTLGMHNLMKNFDLYSGKKRVPFFDKLFDTRIFNDSIMAPSFFHYDFPNHNFFLDHDEWNKFLDDMTHQMDSLRNGFLHEDHKRRYRL